MPWMLSVVRPRSLSAALVITSGSVEIPMVKRQGTSTRMFCLESAFVRLHSMEMGLRSRNAKFWKTGQMKAAPPWIHLAEALRPVLP